PRARPDVAADRRGARRRPRAARDGARGPRRDRRAQARGARAPAARGRARARRLPRDAEARARRPRPRRRPDRAGRGPRRRLEPILSAFVAASRVTPILILKTAALGDVLRTTSLLPGLHERYEDCRVTWVTAPGAADLLRTHPLIRAVEPLDP